MAGTGKIIAIMSGAGLIGGAGFTAIVGARAKKNANKFLDAKVQAGELTKDQVDIANKETKKRLSIGALVTGLLAAVEVAAVTALALLLKAKIK